MIPHVPPGWASRAACRGDNPANWSEPVTRRNSGGKYPDSERAAVKDNEAHCKALCAGCPVRTACLIEACVFSDQFALRAGYRMWIRADRRSARLVAQSFLGEPPEDVRRKLHLSNDPFDEILPERATG